MATKREPTEVELKDMLAHLHRLKEMEVVSSEWFIVQKLVEEGKAFWIGQPHGPQNHWRRARMARVQGL